MSLLKKIGGLEIIISILAIVFSLFFYKSDNVIFKSDRFKEQGETGLPFCVLGAHCCWIYLRKKTIIVCVYCGKKNYRNDFSS